MRPLYSTSIISKSVQNRIDGYRAYEEVTESDNRVFCRFTWTISCFAYRPGWLNLRYLNWIVLLRGRWISSTRRNDQRNTIYMSGLISGQAVRSDVTANRATFATVHRLFEEPVRDRKVLCPASHIATLETRNSVQWLGKSVICLFLFRSWRVDNMVMHASHVWVRGWCKAAPPLVCWPWAYMLKTCTLESIVLGITYNCGFLRTVFCR